MIEYKEQKSDMLETLQPGTKLYNKGCVNVIVSPPCQDCGWHLSISCSYRDPTWEEIRDAWYGLIPDADTRRGAMFFPPKEEYVNVHKYTFHIHEVSKDLKTRL